MDEVDSVSTYGKMNYNFVSAICMTFSPFEICLLLFFALGLRIGWTGQLLALLAISVLVCCSSVFFVQWSDSRYFVHLLIVGASFDAAIQVGFIIGLFTVTHSEVIPLSQARRSAKARRAKLSVERRGENGREAS